MQYKTVAAILAFAAAAVAQSDCSSEAAKIPACALPCLSEAVPKSGCSLTDYSCQCKASNKATITQNATQCVAEKCGAKATDVLTASNAVCACASKSSGGSSGSSSSGGSAPTGDSSSTGGSYPTGAASSSASSSAAPSGTGSSSFPSGSVSPSITPANGASQAVVGLGGVAAGLIAALAL